MKKFLFVLFMAAGLFTTANAQLTVNVTNSSPDFWEIRVEEGNGVFDVITVLPGVSNSIVIPGTVWFPLRIRAISDIGCRARWMIPDFMNGSTPTACPNAGNGSLIIWNTVQTFPGMNNSPVVLNIAI